MRPSYAAVNANYPRRSPMTKDVLYTSLGWSDLIAKEAYGDTCATRMSIALLHCHVPINGTLTIKEGVLKGKAVEPQQAKLSRTLKNTWGKPEVYKSRTTAEKGIAGRSGVASFFRINPGVSNGGHIDLITPGHHGFAVCAMSCYMNAGEIWFWELR